jgi:hypothetical protein
VNTCPLILEYEIINALKFTPDNDDLFTITFLLGKNLLPNPNKLSLDPHISLNIIDLPTTHTPINTKS